MNTCVERLKNGIITENGESYVRYDVGYVSDPCGNNFRH